MSVTQSCILGKLFILVPAQSSRVNGTTEPKLFLQGLSRLQWEAVIAAWAGLAQLFLAIPDCLGIYQGLMTISASCWCCLHHSWYPSWQLKVT